jgi:hypothetical protein
LGFNKAPEKEQAQSAVVAKEEQEVQQEYHTPVEEVQKSYEQELVERWNAWNQVNRQQLNPSAAMKSPVQQPTQQQPVQQPIQQNPQYNYQQVMQRNNMLAQQYNMQRNMMNARFNMQNPNYVNQMNNQYRVGMKFASNNSSVPNYNINAMARQQYQMQQQRRLQFKTMINQEVNPFESIMAMDKPQQAPTKRICLMCGSITDGDSKFCSHCGVQM